MSPPKIPFDQKYIPEPNSGCWLWISTIKKNGYGQMSGNRLAHRVSYEIHVSEIPAGMQVCHRCDTRSCVNPNHLFLGTTQDNTADRHAKGRSVSGEARGVTKLTRQQAAAVLASGEGTKELATRYGVSYSVIYDIRCGRTWNGIASHACLDMGAA